MDCIVRKASPYRLAEFERRQRLTIEDFSTWIASKEDLIISKLFWANDSHSEMQLRDVRNLASTGLRRGLCRALDAEARTRYPLERMQSVTDTPPEIAEMVRARLMALSSPERFLMGIRMCDAARRMVLASLPADLPEPERKRLLFERFYREPMPEQGAEVYAKA